jgi:hypothetical protein
MWRCTTKEGTSTAKSVLREQQFARHRRYGVGNANAHVYKSHVHMTTTAPTLVHDCVHVTFPAAVASMGRMIDGSKKRSGIGLAISPFSP